MHHPVSLSPDNDPFNIINSNKPDLPSRHSGGMDGHCTCCKCTAPPKSRTVMRWYLDTFAGDENLAGRELRDHLLGTLNEIQNLER